MATTSRIPKKTRKQKWNYTKRTEGKAREDKPSLDQKNAQELSSGVNSPGDLSHHSPSQQRLIIAFQNLSAQPFAETLATLMDNGPTPASIRAWAKRTPDRFAQAVAIFARLTGYTEKKVVQHEGLVRIAHMSDAEVEQELEELKTLEARLLEGENVGEGNGSDEDTGTDVITYVPEESEDD